MGARRRARKQAGCARLQWQKCEYRVRPRFALFWAIFSDAHFAVYGARRTRRSKTVPATFHRQGPRIYSEARGVCFGITGARNRPISTLLSSETCAQTPLDRPRTLLRRDPNLPTRLKPPKMAVFVANSPHHAILRVFYVKLRS